MSDWTVKRYKNQAYDWGFGIRYDGGNHTYFDWRMFSVILFRWYFIVERKKDK